jgi:hypothetical protein
MKIKKVKPRTTRTTRTEEEQDNTMRYCINNEFVRVVRGCNIFLL